MGFDIKALEDSLHSVVEPVVIASDAQAILIIEPNDGITPNTSYATLKTLSYDQIGLHILGDVDDVSGDIPIRAEYNISFQFSAFGPNSKKIVSDLNFALVNNLIIHESLASINLFQYNTPIVSDVPVFENTVWEERDQTTISFHHAHEELVNVSVIEQVTVDGTYKDIADNIVLTTSQTIISP
ncbi:MAG: hypothetical protein GWO20_14415 [Candidatus Korarchaeota archaeon]|nr:hypothetical protein [Candidatus Korarchaeota archaeon]